MVGVHVCTSRSTIHLDIFIRYNFISLKCVIGFWSKNSSIKSPGNSIYVKLRISINSTLPQLASTAAISSSSIVRWVSSDVSEHAYIARQNVTLVKASMLVLKPAYLMRQPKTLELLAIERVAAWVVSRGEALTRALHQLRVEGRAEAALAREVDSLRTLLERAVLRTCFNTFAKLVIRGFKKLYDREYFTEEREFAEFKNYCMARMLEIVFSKNLSYLKISHFESFRWLLGEYRYRTDLLQGLTGLKIKFCDTQRENLHMAFIEQLPALTYLALDRCSHSNTMASCIADSCRLMEDLDLSYSRVDDAGVDVFSKLPHLKTLRLESTGVTSEGYKKILLSCKNIEYLYGCDLAHVLQLIESQDECKQLVFGLTNCRAYNKTQLDLQRVVRMCPRLRDVELVIDWVIAMDTEDELTVFDTNVIALTALTDLQKLTLHCYDFNGNRVRGLLQDKGFNLKELRLNSVRHINADAMHFISQACPNLHTLKIKNCHHCNDKEVCKFCEERHKPRFQNKNTEYEIKPFKNLRIASFTFFVNSYIHVQHDIYKMYLEIMSLVLSLSENIEVIEICNSCGISKDFMHDILDRNPMHCLKTLKLEKSTVPKSVLKRLKQNTCDLEVTSLEVLSSGSF